MDSRRAERIPSRERDLSADMQSSDEGRRNSSAIVRKMASVDLGGQEKEAAQTKWFHDKYAIDDELPSKKRDSVKSIE